MNATLPDTHPAIEYYDSDYPGRDTSKYAENFDRVTELQGLAHDVDLYQELAATVDSPVLELFCGSGRVGIPLARQGHAVTGVDVSAGMLDQYRARLEREPDAVASRVTLVRQDVTRLSLRDEMFGLAIAPFNSLLCVTEFEQQLAVLTRAAAHVHEGGRLVLDLMNPLSLALQGDPVPKPFFTRRNEHTGNLYTRFAALGPMNEQQVQELHGWYDEVLPEGLVRRQPYRMAWRLVFRYEIELMLGVAGFDLLRVNGGHRGEPFTPTSRKMIVQAIRRAG